MELNIKIFVATLLDQASGLWFDLPIDEKTVRNSLVRSGAISDVSEELIVSDYEAPFDVSGKLSLKKLNALVTEVKDVNMTVTMFGALIHAGMIDPDTVTADVLNNMEVVSAENLEELGYELVEQAGGISDLSEQQLRVHFDYEDYARSMVAKGLYTDIGGGNYVGVN